MFQVLEPHTVTILTTDKCTARCRHCCMNSSPERANKLTHEQIATALGQMFQHYRMKVVVFAGGEPTLLGDDLLKSIAFCKKHGVGSRIVTNAYWADTPENATAMCKELREAGLDELNISMDDYHEPYVAFANVKRAWQAAKEFDFSAVAIANCYGPQSVLTPDFLEEELGMKEDVKIQRRFDVDGRSTGFEKQIHQTTFVLSNGNVQRLGRGADLIADEEIARESYNTHIATIGGCPHAVRAAALTPRNHLVSCCGFELHGNPILDFGEVTDGNLDRLVENADNDLIVNMIAMIGPPRIMELLKDFCPDEVSFPRSIYQSYCEVCHDLVGIAQNRQAMYKYQGMFASHILAAREGLAEKYQPVLGHGLPLEIGVNIKVERLVPDIELAYDHAHAVREASKRASSAEGASGPSPSPTEIA
ncbi:MAG: radical SAM protein [Deltaproteobacteria bacterium]|nr:radical SAM protein [Deltaproteobacteria bacterium]MCW5805378.1 radical SAM protein [Deltaproteobacteria bacterium]